MPINYGRGASGLGVVSGMPAAPDDAQYVGVGESWDKAVQRKVKSTSPINFDGSEAGATIVYIGSVNATINAVSLALVGADYQVTVDNEATKPNKTLTFTPNGSDTINGGGPFVIEVGESWIFTKDTATNYKVRTAAMSVGSLEATAAMEVADQLLIGRGAGEVFKIDVDDFRASLYETVAIASNATLTGDGTTTSPLAVVTAVSGAIEVIGLWDADTNSPDLSAITLNQGESYQVSVSGSTNLNGETIWAAKDLVVWDDNLAGNYFKIDNTDDVISVNGLTGVVTIDKTGVGLGNVDNTSDANKPVSTAQQTALDGKKGTFTENTAFNKGFGTGSGDVCEGNDARLSDARTPTTHTHLEADITDLGTYLETVTTDATLTGAGTGGSPLSVVTTNVNAYAVGEDFATETVLTLGTWVPIVVNPVTIDIAGLTHANGVFTRVSGGPVTIAASAILCVSGTSNDKMCEFAWFGDGVVQLAGKQCMDAHPTKRYGSVVPTTLITIDDGDTLQVFMRNIESNDNATVEDSVFILKEW